MLQDILESFWCQEVQQVEQFFQVVLQGSSCKQQFVLEGVTIQHPEELGSREQRRNGGEKSQTNQHHHKKKPQPTNKNHKQNKTHKHVKDLLRHRPTKTKNTLDKKS